jgi:formylglycine-generating enzyme
VPRETNPWLQALAVAGGATLVALVAYAGWRQSAPPTYCAEGMVTLRDETGRASRCCGVGQGLRQGRCVGAPLSCAPGMVSSPAGCQPVRRAIALQGGHLRMAPSDWEAASLVQEAEVDVAAFSLDSHEVTEADWQRCAAAQKCPERPLFGEPGRPMVLVTVLEAEQYCRAQGGRLPFSSELAFASAGPAGRRYPWGDTGAVCRRATFGLEDGPCAYGARGPELAGSHPSGASPEGVQDLAGNVAEWALADRLSADKPGLAEARGGSWQDGVASALRAWSSRVVPADTRSSAIGFRCAFQQPAP